MKLEQVDALPAHRDLDDPVQLTQARRGRHQQGMSAGDRQILNRPVLADDRVQPYHARDAGLLGERQSLFRRRQRIRVRTGLQGDSRTHNKTAASSAHGAARGPDRCGNLAAGVRLLGGFFKPARGQEDS